MRSAYTQAASGIIFPLHELLKGHSTASVKRSLEETQWWTPTQIEALRVRRLREFLVHVSQYVPYYRDVISSAGFRPEGLDSLVALRQLPLLDKDTIRANTDDLKALDARDLARFNTGGSTGQPLIFYISKERVSHDVAAKWRATRWWGVDIGDPEIVLWGSPIELGAQDLMRRLRDRLLRTTLLPAFEMSDANLLEFIKVIQHRRPRMLFGYPSSLSYLARYADEHGHALRDSGIKVAFVTAERLYDDQKSRIERVFGCRVANGYGGRDAGFIAHECPQGGMHITAEDIIVEIVNNEGDALPAGQAGEIVVTHLSTRQFPFIRYRTGDIGLLDDNPCACGRGLPQLREIQGRVTDFVVAADGTVMHGLALIYILRDLPGVRSFKIIQESTLRVRVLLVTELGFDDESIGRICESFRARLGEQVEVLLERVSDIPRERSGKHRYVVSQVIPGARNVPPGPRDSVQYGHST